MPPTLGKDASISGIDNTVVRSVNISSDGQQIDCTKRGDTSRKYKKGLAEQTIEVECVEDPGVSVADVLSVTAGHASGSFVVKSVKRTEPLDDIVTWTVSLTRTATAAV